MAEAQVRAIEAQAWSTAITHVDDTRVYLRGYPVDELLQTMSFGGILLLLWRGGLPSKADAALVDACLVAAVDHGPLAPSALSARTASSTRQSPIACLASGLLALTEYHGAGVAGCMRLLLRAPRQGSADAWAREELAAAREAGARLPGVGHRRHPQDVRSERLIELIGEGRDRWPVEAVEALARALSEYVGRPSPVNIDGAVAACLTSIGLDPEYGDLLFAIARSGGLAAHVVEERTRQRPMRTIDPTALDYDGPALQGLATDT